MAVKMKHTTLLDTRKRMLPVDLTYIRVNKSNKKGAAEAFGGQLYPHEDGSFHIVLITKVNGKPKTIDVQPGDYVFATGTSNRWQVLNLEGFNKRFKIR